VEHDELKDASEQEPPETPENNPCATSFVPFLHAIDFLDDAVFVEPGEACVAAFATARFWAFWTWPPII
jgi:hypothetical protein